MDNKVRFSIVLLLIAGVCVGGLSIVYFGVKQKLDEARMQKLLEAAAEASRTTAFTPTVEEMKNYLKKGKYSDETGTEREIYYFETPSGYVIESFGKGYGGKVTVVVGWDKELMRVLHIVVTEHKETPGLGSRVKEKNSENTLWSVIGGNAKDERELRPWFERHFDNLTIEQLVPSKEPIEFVLKNGAKLRGEVFSEDKDTVTVLSQGVKQVLKREEIVEENPQGVKAISGATFTTNAVIEAVKKSHELLRKILKKE